MAVPTLISQLSTVIASNVPAGSESPATLDEYQRAHAAFIAQLHTGTTALAFRAGKSGNQTIALSTTAKIVIDSETLDTATCFDPTTNYRFTPNVAGYYAINGSVYALSGGLGAGATFDLYKNGSVYATRYMLSIANASQSMWCDLSEVVQMNGTTDYLELYSTTNSTAGIQILSSQTSFSGFLIK